MKTAGILRVLIKNLAVRGLCSTDIYYMFARKLIQVRFEMQDCSCRYPL